jgi:Xaa-Pro aminopeptidase
MSELKQRLERWDPERAYAWSFREQYLELPFPIAEYEARLARTRTAMASHGLSALIVGGDRYADGDLRWLTNFHPLIGNAILVLPIEGEPRLALHNELSTVSVWATWVRDVQPPRWGPGADDRTLSRLVDIVRDAAARGRIGIVGDRSLPAAIYQGLVDRTGMRAEFRSDFLTRLRAVKSPAELALIRRSVAIADAGMRAAVEAVGEGVRECEVAGAATGAMFAAGAEDVAFSTIVASGPRADWKHAQPTERKIQAGEPVYVDLGARYQGYCSDLSRTVVPGEPSEDVRRGLEYSLEANRAVVRAARSGTTPAELFRIARSIAEEHGVAEHTMNLGHGMGTAMAELPVLRPDNDEPLEAGMVIAIEPMIVRFGVGTLVVEDDIVVTPDGGELLSHCPQRTWI